MTSLDRSADWSPGAAERTLRIPLGVARLPASVGAEWLDA